MVGSQLTVSEAEKKNQEIAVRTSNLEVWGWVPEETAKILPPGREN